MTSSSVGVQLPSALSLAGALSPRLITCERVGAGPKTGGRGDGCAGRGERGDGCAGRGERGDGCAGSGGPVGLLGRHLRDVSGGVVATVVRRESSQPRRGMGGKGRGRCRVARQELGKEGRRARRGMEQGNMAGALGHLDREALPR
eukprot:scaffold6587_cov103-Isochrysis_galbana.AAC.2